MRKKGERSYLGNKIVEYIAENSKEAVTKSVMASELEHKRRLEEALGSNIPIKAPGVM